MAVADTGTSDAFKLVGALKYGDEVVVSLDNYPDNDRLSTELNNNYFQCTQTLYDTIDGTISSLVDVGAVSGQIHEVDADGWFQVTFGVTDAFNNSLNELSSNNPALQIFAGAVSAFVHNVAQNGQTSFPESQLTRIQQWLGQQ